ncbi:MAG: YfhO family protein, partial [Candidatus Zixiibacteriota bacterium]
LLAHFMYGEQTLTHYCRLFHASILPGSDSDPIMWQRALNNLPLMRQGFLLAALYSSVLSLIVWRALTVIRSRRRWLVAVVPLIMVASGSFSSKFIQPCDRTFGFPDGPVVDIVKENGEATDRTSGFLVRPVWFQFAYNKVQSAQGYSTRQLYWYSEIAGWTKCTNCLNANFANLTGTRYILCPQNWTLPINTLGPVPLDTVAIEDSIVILENHNRFPRTFLVGKYVVEKDNSAIRECVMDPDEDLRALCYLDREPAMDLSPDSLGESSSKISHYSPDSVVVEVETSTNQLLVLSDAYYPAWRAIVDGHEKEILRAYGAFRAVEVPAGSREVVFRYDRYINSLGMYLSIFGLMVAALTLGFAFRRRLK